MKRLAIQSVFSAKAKSGDIRVLDRLELEEFKTKSIQNIMTRLELSGKKCLILDESRNMKVAYSCRNLAKVQYSPAAVTNGYDVLNADVILFTRAGLEKAEEVFS
jgi:large subunit ribosomal protein L4